MSKFVITKAGKALPIVTAKTLTRAIMAASMSCNQANTFVKIIRDQIGCDSFKPKIRDALTEKNNKFNDEFDISMEEMEHEDDTRVFTSIIHCKGIYSLKLVKSEMYALVTVF